MTETFYNVGSLLPEECACFSKNTLQILKEHGVIDRPCAQTHDERGFATVYRCDWEPYGRVEFTADHPFKYKGEMVTFEELIKLHPKIKNAELVPFDDPDLKVVYNIIAHPDQQDERNMFKMQDDLYMVGGRYANEIDHKFFMKRMEILKRLFEDPFGREVIAKKYAPKE
jgi:hypothetical protein